LTSANTLLGQLRQLTSSLQQLSLATPDLPPAHRDPSTGGLLSVSGSHGSAALPHSPVEETEPSLEPRQLNGLSQSFAQMRSVLSEMQTIAFSASASSIGPPAVAPVSIPALSAPQALPPALTQIDASAVASNQPPSSVSLNSSTEQPPVLSARSSAVGAETVIQLSSSLSVEPLPAFNPVLQPSTSVTRAVLELVQPEHRGRLIESSGDLSVYKTGRRRYEVVLGSDVEPIEIALGRRALKGYRVLGAEAHEDGVQLMMRDRDRWASGLFNHDGDLTSVESLTRSQARSLESKFDQDFDRNGIVDRLGSTSVVFRLGSNLPDVSIGSQALFRAEENPAGSADHINLATPSM